MMLTIPIDVEVKAKATSQYDATTIERRMAVLADRTDDAAVREVEYLMGLLAKLGA